MKMNNKKLECDRSVSKRSYVSPALKMTIVELEMSIASGSANLHPGDAANPNNPKVSDWNDGGTAGGETTLDF